MSLLKRMESQVQKYLTSSFKENLQARLSSMTSTSNNNKVHTDPSIREKLVKNLDEVTHKNIVWDGWTLCIGPLSAYPNGLNLSSSRNMSLQWPGISLYNWSRIRQDPFPSFPYLPLVHHVRHSGRPLEVPWRLPRVGVVRRPGCCQHLLPGTSPLEMPKDADSVDWCGLIILWHLMKLDHFFYGLTVCRNLCLVGTNAVLAMLGAFCQVLRSDCLSIYEKFRPRCPSWQSRGHDDCHPLGDRQYQLRTTARLLHVFDLHNESCSNTLQNRSDGATCCSQCLIPGKELETPKSGHNIPSTCCSFSMTFWNAKHEARVERLGSEGRAQFKSGPSCLKSLITVF